jgi:glyoxylase I family protein
MKDLFLGIEHLAIAAKNPQALAEWYSRVLGFRARITFDNGAEKRQTYFIGLGGGVPYIELIPADVSKQNPEKPNADPGISHVAVLVSDYERAVASLAESGARKEGDERAAPFGARVQFYRDPEGNLFHILFRPQPLPLRD